MSSDDITPDATPEEPCVDVTVSVPEHRVAQFERFHPRFLEMAAHWDAQVGNEDLRGPRGRRGRRGSARAITAATAATATRARRPRQPRARGLMADKPVTVDVPEDRVPEFYLWFAAFLAAARAPARRAAGRMPRPRRGFGRRVGPWGHTSGAAWTGGRRSTRRALALRPPRRTPARELFDLLHRRRPASATPATRSPRRCTSRRAPTALAGILAWPGRWCRKLGLEFPITTTAREDGGTDYAIEPAIAELFSGARAGAPAPPR